MRPISRMLYGLLLLLSLLASAGGVAGGIERQELDNGFQVVVLEDHRAPVVVNQIWYRVGSIDEYRGVTGISHALEHMMFKGTENLEPGEFSRRVARAGGRENAFTGRDYTGYHQSIAADRLDMLLELEAERMVRLDLRQEEFEPEMRVVREERRERVEDRPRSLLWERIRAAAFPSSPAGLPIIGWPSDLERLAVDDLEQWYRNWYGPNNAVLVVAGAVDAADVFERVEAHFGALEPIDLPRRLPVEEVEAVGEHRLELHAPANVPYIGLACRAPSLATLDDPRDAWALSVLAGVLEGRSGRLESRLVRSEGLATRTSASYSPFARSEALFSIAASPADERSAEALEAALRNEIAQLREEPIDDEELARVRTRTRAEEVFRLDSVMGRARRVALLETLGLGYETWDDYLDGIEEVTAADVQRVAEAYLSDRRLTVGTLVPEGTPVPGARDDATPGGEEHVDH